MALGKRDLTMSNSYFFSCFLPPICMSAAVWILDTVYRCVSLLTRRSGFLLLLCEIAIFIPQYVKHDLYSDWKSTTFHFAVESHFRGLDEMVYSTYL